MGVVRLLTILLAAAGVAYARDPGAGGLTRRVAGAAVDFGAGTITAQAGAAADMRMPGPNAARPGAERRARAAAEAKLQASLHELGVDKTAAKAALDHASVAHIEYQSNGGVVLWLAVRFSDVAPGKVAAKPLRVPTMALALAPVLSSDGKTVQTASATYRAAAECPRDAITAKRDGKGHLVLPRASAELLDSFAGAAVVIYVEKPEP